MFGDNCNMTTAQLSTARQNQNSVLNELAELSKVASPSKEIIVATISASVSMFSASTVTIMTDESINTSSKVLTNMMKNSLTLDISMSTISPCSNIINNFMGLAVNNISKSAKSSIQSMYESYSNTVGLSAINHYNASKRSNTSISLPNMALLVTTVQQVNSISSLSSMPSHELTITTSSLGIGQQSVYNQNIPLVLSVSRATLYDTSDTLNGATYNKVTSNPLRLQVDCSLLNKTQVQLVLYHTSSQAYDPIVSITKPVKTICSRGRKASRTYVCEYTDKSTYNITVTCDGSKNANFTTACPSRPRTPSCNDISALGQCVVLSSSSDKVVCSCTICDNKLSRKLLSVDSAAYQFAGMLQYTVDEYISTTTSTSFSLYTISNSITVLITFSVLWVIIILIVPVKTMIYKRKNKRKESKGSIAVVPEDVAHSITLEKRLRDYIKSCIPTVYHEEQSYMKRLFDQLLQNHLYINLFLVSNHSTYFMSYCEALKVITMLTASMFFLVIMFNTEYPSDDNSCPTFSTDVDCLNRKTFHGRNNCVWKDEECKFKEEEVFPIFTIIFLAWFELLILAPLGSLIIFIFDEFILAPTRKNVENKLKASHSVALGQRLSQVGSEISSGIRRLSAVGSQLRRLSLVSKTILVDDSLIETRRSAINLLPYNISRRHHHHHTMEQEDASNAGTAQVLYQRAIHAIKTYRSALSGDNLIEFDRLWERYFKDNSSSDDSDKYDSFSNALYLEVLKVQEQSTEIYTSLKSAPVHICGIEILKTFFVDLLGRGTEEADIFLTIFDNNLKAKKVVSIYTKVVMILLMVGLNIYFTYISLLYCSDKSHQWQLHWLGTFLTIFSIDIFFNCLCEAYLLKYMVPMAINHKIGNINIFISILCIT